MTFYFYDVETSGRSPRGQRIMQFAGVRTDKNFKPVGEPHNVLIKLTPDILPEPDAILTHGISPQKTLEEGLTEAEFIKIFNREIATPDTVFVGYNNIRFDDEFMRHILWRNFADAYEWQWKDGASRWDLLDVARMCRALRPKGVVWPKTDANNRLPTLAKLNKLEHSNAHDALSDVEVLIDFAKLLRAAQPKLFDYLLNLRLKNKLEPFVKAGQSFVYASGHYPKETLHTTVVSMVAAHPEKSSVMVFDLRQDPEPYLKMSAKDLAKLWLDRNYDAPRFAIKELGLNRCPAVAPLNVLDRTTLKNLQLDLEASQANFKKLQADKEFGGKILEALKIVEQARHQKYGQSSAVDEQLYDGFVGKADQVKMRAVRVAQPEKLDEFAGQFEDDRLNRLLPLYKARNFPKALSGEEQNAWQGFCAERLSGGGANSLAARTYSRLDQLKSDPKLSQNDQYLLEELSLYGQSILPSE